MPEHRGIQRVTCRAALWAVAGSAALGFPVVGALAQDTDPVAELANPIPAGFVLFVVCVAETGHVLSRKVVVAAHSTTCALGSGAASWMGSLLQTGHGT